MEFLHYIVALFLSATNPNVEVDFASTFAFVNPKTGERDKHAGGKSPCLKRLVRPTDNVIAHRTLPCGTKVRLTNLRTGTTVVSRVGERGPYGACTKKGWSKFHPDDVTKPNVCPRKPYNYWKLKRCLRKSDGSWYPRKCKNYRTRKRMGYRGVWRGGFDLTPRVSRRLKHNGFELIKLEVIE